LEDARAVSFDDACALAEQMKFTNVIECSAKTGAAVKDLFGFVASHPTLAIGTPAVATLVTKKSCC
jgi:hypothetical protein